MTRFSPSLSIALMSMFAFASSGAFGAVECNRKTNNTSGFSSAKVHDSWYPKVIYFEIENAKKKGTRRLRFSEGYAIDSQGRFRLPTETIWEMLPNGQVFGKFAGNQQSGYQNITPRKYTCSMNVSEILAKQASGASETKQQNSPEKQAARPQQTKLDRAKSECADLGFKSGTEKHGDCVLKLLDNL